MNIDLTLIDALIASYCDSALRKDPDAMLALYDESVRLFDLWDQAEVRGRAAWAPVVRDWLGGLGDETVHVRFEDVEIQVAADTALVTGFVHFEARNSSGAKLRSMKNRLTWSLARRGDGWKIVHQHTSLPIDPKTIAPKFNA